MFSVDEQVVYGSIGVCTVKGMGIPDMPGATRECYVLEPHYVAHSKVYAPIEDNPVKIRSLLSVSEVEELVDSMPEIKAFPLNKERQEQYSTYRSVIKSADSFLLAKLLRTLYEKKEKCMELKKPLPGAEKDFLDTAEKMLYGEMAAILQIPMDQVLPYIQSRLRPEFETPGSAAS